MRASRRQRSARRLRRVAPAQWFASWRRRSALAREPRRRAGSSARARVGAGRSGPSAAAVDAVNRPRDRQSTRRRVGPRVLRRARTGAGDTSGARAAATSGRIAGRLRSTTAHAAGTRPTAGPARVRRRASQARPAWDGAPSRRRTRCSSDPPVAASASRPPLPRSSSRSASARAYVTRSPHRLTARSSQQFSRSARIAPGQPPDRRVIEQQRLDDVCSRLTR